MTTPGPAPGPTTAPTAAASALPRALWIGLGIATALAFLLRAAWWAFADPIPVSDFWEYKLFAEKLWERGEFGIVAPTAYRLPGYPLFLAVMMIASSADPWLSFTSVVLSVGLVPLIGWIGWQLTGRAPIAVLAAVLTAFNPTFVFFGSILGSEHLFCLLIFGAFSCLLGAPGPGWKPLLTRLGASGALFGAAILTRGEALFYTPVLAAVALRPAFRAPFEAPRWKRLLLAALPVLIGAAVAFPWYVRNAVLVGPGAGLTTTGGLNFYYAHNDVRYGYHALDQTPFGEHGIVTMQITVFEGGDEVLIQKLGYELGWQHLRESPWRDIAADIGRATHALLWTRGDYAVIWSRYLPREKPNTPYPTKEIPHYMTFVRLTEAYFALAVLAAAGAFLIWRFRPWAPLLLVGIVVMNWLGYAVIFWAKDRYRFTAEVAMGLLAAIALYEATRLLVKLADQMKLGEEEARKR